MKLVTKDATMRFGGLTAVSALAIEIDKGEIVGLIGPNGAGKTTAFNMITGVYAPTEGRILFDGQDITGRQPHQINKAGIARTFQNIRLFSTMSVLENVLVGCAVRERPNWINATLRTPGYRKHDRESHQFAMELLSETGLAEPRQRRRHGPPVRQAAQARDRPRPRDQAFPPPPRRARGGHEPPGGLRAHGLHP